MVVQGIPAPYLATTPATLSARQLAGEMPRSSTLASSLAAYKGTQKKPFAPDRQTGIYLDFFPHLCVEVLY